MFNLTVIINVNSTNDIETVASALKSLALVSVVEKGCLQYELHQDAETKNIFILYETWESKDIWELHLKTPHFKQYYEGIVLPKITRQVYFTEKLI